MRLTINERRQSSLAECLEAGMRKKSMDQASGLRRGSWKHLALGVPCELEVLGVAHFVPQDQYLRQVRGSPINGISVQVDSHIGQVWRLTAVEACSIRFSFWSRMISQVYHWTVLSW